MRFHTFKINELLRNGAAMYWYYIRYFLHVYDKKERSIFEAHFELIAKKKDRSPIAITLRINPDSDSIWSGHFLIFGAGFFWGHSAFRKLGKWLVRCKEYRWDSRTWEFRISDGHLWWRFADHDDMCRSKHKPRSRYTFRDAVINLSLADAIWGRKRYTYDTIDKHLALLKLPEGEYPAVLELQKVLFGRTKVAKEKHIQSWSIEVDSPTGIPTHYDKSGGWKGDRTYGFGVNFAYPRSEGWQLDAEAAVTAWVLQERARTGFREPQPLD